MGFFDATSGTNSGSVFGSMFGFGRRSRKKATGALADFYAAEPVDTAVKLKDAPLLAVDVETTGLNPKKDMLLSIGWVPIDGLSIKVGQAGYGVIHHPEDQLQALNAADGSATIHGLTHSDIAAGEPAQEVLERLLTALQGRAMVVHFSQIEKTFLSEACRRHFGSGLSVPIVDTFAIERRHFERMATYPRGEDLRLPRVRHRYGLPHYPSHNALTDALACGELLLAMIGQRRNQNGPDGALNAILEQQYR